MRIRWLAPAVAVLLAGQAYGAEEGQPGQRPPADPPDYARRPAGGGRLGGRAAARPVRRILPRRPQPADGAHVRPLPLRRQVPLRGTARRPARHAPATHTFRAARQGGCQPRLHAGLYRPARRTPERLPLPSERPRRENGRHPERGDSKRDDRPRLRLGRGHAYRRARLDRRAADPADHAAHRARREPAVVGNRHPRRAAREQRAVGDRPFPALLELLSLLRERAELRRPDTQDRQPDRDAVRHDRRHAATPVRGGRGTT